MNVQYENNKENTVIVKNYDDNFYSFYVCTAKSLQRESTVKTKTNKTTTELIHNVNIGRELIQ